MIIVFSMDGIKHMDLLYTWTTEYSEEIGLEGIVERYQGDEYCKNLIDSLTGWAEKKYLEHYDRKGKASFILTESKEYAVSFMINTYNDKIARMEVTISAPDMDNYDHKLEELKLALKERLLPDWQSCTWLVDGQAAQLCKEAFEYAFNIENNLRAFASKVLIHFLGVNWINMFGFEEISRSVKSLKRRFEQRVPGFDGINTDFMSMTLETLCDVIFDGVIYKEEPIAINKEEYLEFKKKAKAKKSGDAILNYLKDRLIIDKKIWDDCFAQYIEDINGFKKSIHSFIEDRNHIAHCKVLSWSAYKIILNDFRSMDEYISKADAKFEKEEVSTELLATWEAEYEKRYASDYEQEYLRERLAEETGMDILNIGRIEEWFNKVMYELYSEVYQRYHLDVCREVTGFSGPSPNNPVFSVSCPVDEKYVITVFRDFAIDDSLGGDSLCNVVAKDSNENDICKAEIHFHNGSGFEDDLGLMEIDEVTEYDTSELATFKEELFSSIDDLNPYPAELDSIAYENQGLEGFVASFPCEQCGHFGVSLNDTFFPFGKCCYCGYKHELKECARCGELVPGVEHGLCPCCASYVDKQ